MRPRVFREFWVELGGDPSNDKEVYKRYCSSKEFEPTSYAEEVVHFIEYDALEKLKKENDDLRKIIAKEVSENDEFGSEFVIASILRAENLKLRQLILLVDPAVSNEQMNTLSAKQWAEFLRWQEAEGYANDKN